MGMYNEVRCRCPHCGSSDAQTQVSQYVLGFGEFHLDDPQKIVEQLTESQIDSFLEEIKEANFHCDQCDRYFGILKS